MPRPCYLLTPTVGTRLISSTMQRLVHSKQQLFDRVTMPIKRCIVYVLSTVSTWRLSASMLFVNDINDCSPRLNFDGTNSFIPPLLFGCSHVQHSELLRHVRCGCAKKLQGLFVGISKSAILMQGSPRLTLSKYCSAECQRNDWAQHKVHCRSASGKASWQPQWLSEDRVPSFVGSSPLPKPFGAGKKYLWGNVPAHDILQLLAHEGANYDKDLHLLFAGKFSQLVSPSLPNGRVC